MGKERNKYEFWLAVNLYHEARGEPEEGMVAIGHVVINRAMKRRKNVKEIILQPWQFSWRNSKKDIPIDDYDSFIRCMDAVDKIIIERLEGKDLFRADHYFNPSIVLPSWAKKMTFVQGIGGHDFYRE